jgi:hypothetical protein
MINNSARYVCLSEEQAYKRAELIKLQFNIRAGTSSTWKNVKKVEVIKVQGDEYINDLKQLENQNEILEPKD